MSSRIGAIGAAVLLLAAAAGGWWLWGPVRPGASTDAQPAVTIALAGPMSGPSARIGAEMEAAVRILLDQVNEGGGINGRRIDIKVFDDANDAQKAARIGAEIAQDSSLVAVIGHSLSTTSLSAAPAYRAAGLAAVTPAATTPALTESGDSYFSTIYSDRIQGRFMAEYASHGLKASTAVTVVGTGAYAVNLSQAFLDRAKTLGLTIARTEQLASGGQSDTLRPLVQRIGSAAANNSAIVVFAERNEAFAIVKAIRDAGLTQPILGPDAIGAETFADQFAKLPAEIAHPGVYTSNLFVSVPFISAIANPEGRQLVDALDKSIGPLQSWIAPYAYDSAKLLVEAIRRQSQDGKAAAALRRGVLEELKAWRDGPVIVEGATGPIRFDAHGAGDRPITIGIFQGGLVSSLLQLQVDAGDSARPLELKSIVYGGLQPTRIEKVDLLSGTATFAFDIWFRYQGKIDLSGLEFDNAVEAVKLGKPVQESEFAGLHYLRYSATGRFKLNFNRTPSSPRRQLLQIAVHQAKRGESNIAFVPDALGLPAVAGPKLASYVMANLSESAGWRIRDADLTPHFTSTPAKGDPAFLSRRINVFQQPGFLFTGELVPSASSWRDFINVDLATAAMVAILLGICLFRLFLGHWPLAERPRLELLALAIIAVMALAVIEASSLQRIGGGYRQLLLENARVFFNCLWWIIPALLVNAAISRFIWDPLEAATRQAVPRVIKNLVGFIVLMLAFFGIVAFVFDQQITSLLATSGLIAMIIGLAIQSNISHIFSGIALNIERPFRPGDWIKVGEVTGKVVDISWRSTKLETFANTTISIPNSSVGNSQIENFTYPNERYFIFQILYFGLEHDPARITQLLYDALKVVKSVDGRDRLGLMWVKFNGVDHHGQKFLVAFDCNDRMLKNSQEHVVLVSIYQVLARCGIHPTTTNVNIHVSRAVPDLGEAALTVEHLVENAGLFEPLGAEGRATLARNAIPREFNAGECIVRQGDPGDSLFLIAQGVVAVEVELEGRGQPVEVARLGAGSYFGEMALLTGDARASTVKAMDHCRLFEVPKQAIQPLLEGSLELGEQLSNILAARQLENETHGQNNVEFEQAKREISRGLFGRIRRFFAAPQQNAAK